jgi:heme A synthase
VGFHLVFIATAAAAMLAAREWYHRLLAPALLLMICLYVGLLFTQLRG